MKELDEIRERAEAATPGPWEWDGTDVSQCSNGWSLVMENTVSCMSYCYGGSVSQEVKPADATFIAHAQEDVSRLLSAIDDLLYIADNKTADNQMGRWWRGVIRGTIEKHIRTPDDSV